MFRLRCCYDQADRDNEMKMFTAAYEVCDLGALKSVTSYITKHYLVYSPLYFIKIHYSRLFIFNIILFIFSFVLERVLLYITIHL